MAHYSSAEASRFKALLRASIWVIVVAATFEGGNAGSSLEDWWAQELPFTAMPEAVAKMESPLSVESSEELLSQLYAGGGRQEYCSLAANRGYCSARESKASSSQPRVCIPPYFNYEYGVLPCRHGAAAAAAQAASKSAIFFTPNALREGKAMVVPRTSNALDGAYFLPQALSQALPLDPDHLPQLASFYGVAPGSDMDLHMQNTLTHCSYVPKHEIKSCHSSGESMVSFVASSLGRHASVRTPAPIAKKQRASVLRVQQLARPGDTVLPCHDMEFPSLVYSCHVTRSAQVLDVSLQLESGDVAHGLATCHLDTSFWNPSHVAFEALHVKPGSSVCHWLPENSFVFLKS